MSSDVIKNYLGILDRVNTAARKVGKSLDDIQLIAVSKGKPAQVMQELINGTDEKIVFGENYLQEFKQKRPELSGAFKAHFIGHLQRNKAKDAIKLFDLIESVDSLRLAQALNIEAQKAGKKQEIYLQVNISDDPEKGGFSVETLKQFLTSEVSALNSVALCGLMTITKFYDNPEDVRPDFRAMAELKRMLLADSTARQRFKNEQIALSMGMSSDFEIAIEEGATVVRVGTAIFGERG